MFVNKHVTLVRFDTQKRLWKLYTEFRHRIESFHAIMCNMGNLHIFDPFSIAQVKLVRIISRKYTNAIASQTLAVP